MHGEEVRALTEACGAVGGFARVGGGRSGGEHVGGSPVARCIEMQ